MDELCWKNDGLGAFSVFTLRLEPRVSAGGADTLRETSSETEESAGCVESCIFPEELDVLTTGSDERSTMAYGAA